MIGTTLSRYTITGQLGAGGMGEVYLAEDPALERKVAIKVLAKELAGSREARQRLAREARSAAALDHPYICKIYEVAADENRDFIVMEYVEGETLAARLQGGPLAVTEVIPTAIEIAEALQKAHSRSIVHRDLKPANIMLAADGHVKVMDFGLAKTVEAGEVDSATDETLTAPLTQHGAIVGTPGYMSPEQLRGEPVDVRSDFFSFGLVLYEMLAGTHPFRRSSAAETLAAVLRESPTPLSAAAPEAPAGLCAIVDRLLAKEAGRRFVCTTELLTALRTTGNERPAPASWPGAAPAKRFSIAVLPFSNVSADPENDFLADGLAEDLINQLARIDGVKVVARTSAFQFRGRDLDIREIGATLGVGTVLEGSVRAAGNRLRVGAQLIDAGDGCHLWTERFDRQRTDIFDIQDEISAAIGERIRAILGRELRRDRSRPGPEKDRSPEAHAAFLKGRYRMVTLTPGGFESARAYFEQAIAIDPGYADAHAALSWLAINVSHFGGKDPRPLYREARHHARRALEISDAVADAHGGLAFVYMYGDWNWAESDRAFQRSIELAPGSALLRLYHACLWSVIGRHEEAVAEAYRAQELDPLAGIVNGAVGLTLNGAGRYEEAARELTRGIELDPDYWLGYSHRGVSHCMLGDYERAAADSQAAWDRSRDPQALVGLIIALERAGRGSRAAEWLRRLEGMTDGPFVRPFHWAMLELARGRLDEGFVWLEKSLDARDGLVPWMPESPVIRDTSAAIDPRFAAARERLGMPPTGVG